MTPREDGGNNTPRMSTGGMTPRHGNPSSTRADWIYATPSVQSTAYDETALEYPEEYPGDDEDRLKWVEEQAQLDRDWYQMDESGVSKAPIDHLVTAMLGHWRNPQPICRLCGA